MGTSAGRFLLFCKVPRAGGSKTRMHAALSPQRAAGLAGWLAARAAAALAHRPAGWDVVLCVDDPAHRFAGALSRRHGWPLDAQGEGDLGERMARLLGRALAVRGRAIIVGGDCLGYDRGYLASAVAALDGGADVVLGPASDGGYVLVGASRPLPGLFDGVPWGSARVLCSQRARLRELGLGWAELPPRSDIDRPEDLAGIEGLPARFRPE